MNSKKLQIAILRNIRFKGLWTPEHHELFSDYKLLKTIILVMTRPFKNEKIEKVVAIDGAGFLLGALLANTLHSGLILIRKEGSISSPTYKTTFIDYTGKQRSLEIKRRASLRRGERILIVDDWAETGAHLRHTLKLLAKFHPHVVGISLLINEMNKRRREAFRKYRIKEIIDFQKIKKPDW